MIDEKFLSQRQKLEQFSKATAQARIDKLKKIRDALNFYREELKEALYADFKKPLIESDLTEIQPSVSSLNFILSNLRNWMKPIKVKTSLLVLGTSSAIHYGPRGQVLVISPWNYPIFMSLIPVAEAVAAGNGVILKPSEFTPHTNRVLKKLLDSVFNENEVIVIEGAASVATELLALPFHHIFFTGSTAVGKIVMQAAAKNLASVTLELGGKSPCIVDEDANLPDAIKKIVWGKFVNGGQTCIAPDFIFVHEKIASDFIEGCKNKIAEIYQDKENLAHIINSRHTQRLKQLVGQAIQEGATLVCGNEYDEILNFMSPTIILNPSFDSKIMQEEIFGPVMPVVTFKTATEVVEILRKSPRPLAFYIFSNTSENQKYYTDRIISGSVAINEVILQVSNHHLPFGGINESGIGSYHGKAGFKTFSHERSVLKRNINLGVDYFYPPYTKTKYKLVDFIFRFFNHFL